MLEFLGLYFIIIMLNSIDFYYSVLKINEECYLAAYIIFIKILIENIKIEDKKFIKDTPRDSTWVHMSLLVREFVA